MAKQRTDEELHRRKIPRLGCLPHEWDSIPIPVCSSLFQSVPYVTVRQAGSDLATAWHRVGAEQHATQCGAVPMVTLRPCLVEYRRRLRSVAQHRRPMRAQELNRLGVAECRCASNVRPRESFLARAVCVVRRGARQVVALHRRCRRQFRRARCSDSAACRPARPHSEHRIALTHGCAHCFTAVGPRLRGALCIATDCGSTVDAAGGRGRAGPREADAAARCGRAWWRGSVARPARAIPLSRSHLVDPTWPIPLSQAHLADPT